MQLPGAKVLLDAAESLIVLCTVLLILHLLWLRLPLSGRVICCHSRHHSCMQSTLSAVALCVLSKADGLNVQGRFIHSHCCVPQKVLKRWTVTV